MAPTWLELTLLRIIKVRNVHSIFTSDLFEPKMMIIQTDLLHQKQLEGLSANTSNYDLLVISIILKQFWQNAIHPKKTRTKLYH